MQAKHQVSGLTIQLMANADSEPGAAVVAEDPLSHEARQAVDSAVSEALDIVPDSQFISAPREGFYKARQQSMSALSGTLSASSSLSGSRSNTSPTISTQRYKHYHKPTVSEEPELVDLCKQFIADKNVAGLAQIARDRGLPPALRQYAWPMLLSSHPYVQQPSLPVEALDSFTDTTDDSVPSRRIEKDISRCRKRLASNNARRNPQPHKTGGSTPVTSSLTQISHLHTAFSTPLSTSPSSSSVKSTAVSFDMVAELLSSTRESQVFEIIQSAVESFLVKWSHVIPYEPAMVWVAIALSEWVNPVYEMEPHAGDSTSNVSTPELAPMGEWETNHAAQFAEAFENIMLIMLHAPQTGKASASGNLESPVPERIALFLTILRRMMPSLSRHFDEEDIISGAGDDEWLLWWFRWMGARVLDKNDRGRIWDVYLGWRECGEQSIVNTGPDAFWKVSDKAIDETFAPSKMDAPVDLHTRHLFICLAILESKASTLVELDGAEIREALMRVRKTEDIEMVCLEAGELYRSWQWREDDDSDE